MSQKLRGLVTASMEEFEDTPPVYLPVESAEDETSMVVAANDHLNDASVDNTETTRLIDLAEGLEDLAEVGGTITEATPRELVLVDIANQLALAGSGVKPEEVLPGLESRVGQSISMETVKETALKIWNGIMAFIKRIWEHIENFFIKLVSTLPNVKKRAERMRDAARKIGAATPKAATVVLGSEANGLAVNHIAPKNGDQMLAVLGNVESQAKVVFGDYVKQVEAVGKGLIPIIDKLSKGGRADWIGDVVAAVSVLNFGKIKQELGCHPVSDSRWVAGTVQLAAPLPGNHSIAFHRPAHAPEGPTGQSGSDERMANASQIFSETFGQIYFDVVKTTDAHHDHTLTKQEFTTMTPAQIIKACEHVIAVCDTLIGYHNGADKKAIRSMVNRIGAQSWIFGKSIDIGVASGAMKPTDQTYFQGVIKILRMYNTWSTSLTPNVAKVAATTVRAVMSCCARSLAQYEGMEAVMSDSTAVANVRPEVV